jgi:hypothetical protein
MTVHEAQFCNYMSMFGVESVIHKCRNKWIVRHRAFELPERFLTKKAAADAALQKAISLLPEFTLHKRGIHLPDAP